MRIALSTAHALAQNHAAEEAVTGMIHTTDSVLSSVDYSVRLELMNALELERTAATEGFTLYTEFKNGSTDREGLIERCEEVVSNPAIFAPYHRAVLILNSARSGSGDHLEMATDYALLLHETCYPLANHFPGSTEVFAALAEISSASDMPGHSEILMQCFRYTLELDHYGSTVYRAVLFSEVENTSQGLPEFWRDNGGPIASVVLYSPGGELIPDGQLSRLLLVPGAEKPGFRIPFVFTTASIAMSLPGSIQETVAGKAVLNLEDLRLQLTDSLGMEEGERTFTNLINSEMIYIESSSFTGKYIKSFTKGNFGL